MHGQAGQREGYADKECAAAGGREEAGRVFNVLSHGNPNSDDVRMKPTTNDSDKAASTDIFHTPMDRGSNRVSRSKFRSLAGHGRIVVNGFVSLPRGAILRKRKARSIRYEGPRPRC